MRHDLAQSERNANKKTVSAVFLFGYFYGTIVSMENLALAMTVVERMHEGVLWLVFFIVLFLYAIATTILVYHWHKYGLEGDRTLVRVGYFYGALSLSLILIAGVSLYMMYMPV